jgi:hypothetical protein
MAIVVLAMVFTGAIAGSLLAIWKCRVLCLLPAITFLVLIALLIGVIERASPGTIALQIIAAIVALQLSYLAAFQFAQVTSWPRMAHRMRPVDAPLPATEQRIVDETAQQQDGVAYTRRQNRETV